MTDRERTGFLQRIRELERTNSELKVTAQRLRRHSILGMAGLLILFLLTAAVLGWREKEARQDAEHYRWMIEDQRRQRNFERTASPEQIGRAFE